MDYVQYAQPAVCTCGAADAPRDLREAVGDAYAALNRFVDGLDEISDGPLADALDDAFLALNDVRYRAGLECVCEAFELCDRDDEGAMYGEVDDDGNVARYWPLKLAVEKAEARGTLITNEYSALNLDLRSRRERVADYVLSPARKMRALYRKVLS
jgi:hypothetical protein